MDLAERLNIATRRVTYRIQQWRCSVFKFFSIVCTYTILPNSTCLIVRPWITRRPFPPPPSGLGAEDKTVLFGFDGAPQTVVRVVPGCAISRTRCLFRSPIPWVVETSLSWCEACLQLKSRLVFCRPVVPMCLSMSPLRHDNQNAFDPVSRDFRAILGLESKFSLNGRYLWYGAVFLYRYKLW